MDVWNQNIGAQLPTEARMDSGGHVAGENLAHRGFNLDSMDSEKIEEGPFLDIQWYPMSAAFVNINTQNQSFF